MFRFFFYLMVLVGLAFGGWYAWENVPFIRAFVEDKVEIGNFQTLEVRHTAEQIMKGPCSSLVKHKGYNFLEPKLMFYPYVMMEVKFLQSGGQTGEGILLWGLTDGEMVIDSSTWEKTHGFEDCITSHANRNDFRVLKVLVAAGGSIDREQLYKSFHTDVDTIDRWVDSCRAKKLVALCGAKFHLHFQEPNLHIFPETKLSESLVMHPSQYSAKVKKRYSVTQIKKLAETAFGTDFAIRKTEEVFLPVYSIAIQNPDGSILTTYWNALNGQRLDPKTCR